METPLFPGYEPPPIPDLPGVDLSADRRRTLRQRSDIERGVHPLMRTPLHEQAPTDPDPSHRTRPFTCGTCAHRWPSEGSHSWPKCDIGPRSHGPATDCRAWWPACMSYEAAR